MKKIIVLAILAGMASGCMKFKSKDYELEVEIPMEAAAE